MPRAVPAGFRVRSRHGGEIEAALMRDRRFVHLHEQAASARERRPCHLPRRVAAAEFAQARPLLVAGAMHGGRVAAARGFGRRLEAAARRRPREHVDVQMRVSPCAEQPERKRRGQAHTLDAHAAAARERERQVGTCAAAGGDVDRDSFGPIGFAVEADARRVGAIVQRDENAAVLAGEAVHGGDAAQRDAHEIAVREMHRDEREAREQKREEQRDAVRIVEAREQHHEQQRGERDARRGSAGCRRGVSRSVTGSRSSPCRRRTQAAPRARRFRRHCLAPVTQRHRAPQTGTATPRMRSVTNAAWSAPAAWPVRSSRCEATDANTACTSSGSAWSRPAISAQARAARTSPWPARGDRPNNTSVRWRVLATSVCT